VLAYEVFQATGPRLLPFLFVLYTVIMLYDFFDTLPVQSDHFGHGVGLSAEIDSHFAFLPFNFGLLFGEGLLDVAGLHFAVFYLFLAFTVEIFTHPYHLLDHEFEMDFICRCGYLSGLLFGLDLVLAADILELPL